MAVVVQKFGGTSVANADKILRAARRAINAQNAGANVAVIVSARGDLTDELIALAAELHPSPPARELDMLVSTGEQQSIALLAMAIDSLGGKAYSLTGGQIGIRTDSAHGKARIREISTDRIKQVFAEGKIAIIAGFQGIDEELNITTLGRGGSDTTAVAIAAALAADVCEIYTDVDGVFTTDPRVVPQARKIEQISYDEMLELASVGAGVMHSRSIEFAKKYGVNIHVRNSGHDGAGTIIRPEAPEMEHVVVRGAALVKAEARVTIQGVPNTPGVVYKIFSSISSHSIVVDMIVQNVATHGKTEVSFTVAEGDLPRTLEIAKEVKETIGAEGFDFSADVSKVSVVGLGMRTHTGVANRMFRALADRGVNILMITTSEIKISVLVDEARGAEALAAVHEEFELDKPLPEHKEEASFRIKSDDLVPRGTPENRLQSIARSLPAMEDILVSNVDADDRQGRVTLYGVPDRPGVAYKIFSRVADANVPVDMIVQNVGTDSKTHLSFTVPKGDLEKAGRLAQELMDELGGGEVDTEGAMVKISVRGVGMRSHTGVAVNLSRALADKGVNIQLINTSELHLTVVVDAAAGDVARKALSDTFCVTE